MRPVRFALLAWLFVWACSDPQFKEPPAVVPNPDLELLSQDLRRYVGAVCEFQERCGRDDVDSCVSSFLIEVCGGTSGALELPALDECMSVIGELGCTENAYEVPACLPVRVAMHRARPNSAGNIVGEGQACDDEASTYCDLGLFCDADPGQCGTCRKSQAIGNACRPEGSGECRYDAYCSEAGVCEADKPAGSPCTFDDECVGMLLCLRGKCQNVDDLVGTACESEEDCGYRLPCREGQCRALKNVGEACSEAIDCRTQACFERQCVEQARCERGEQGMGCYWDEQCKPGLVCDYNSSTCTEAIADGESGCFDNSLPYPSRCVPGSTCTRAAGTEGDGPENFVCAKEVHDGGPCTSPGYDGKCNSSYCSEQLTCGAWPPLPMCK